jgi:hypothetical protein
MIGRGDQLGRIYCKHRGSQNRIHSRTPRSIRRQPKECCPLEIVLRVVRTWAWTRSAISTTAEEVLVGNTLDEVRFQHQRPPREDHMLAEF